MAKTATVVLMCGVPGSGKTSYAKILERDGFVRLSVDEEMWRLDQELAARFGSPEYFDFTVAVERQLRTWLVELMCEGRDVVVDLSFWSRQRREEYKALITAHGAAWQLVYLDVPRDELLRRLELRRLDPGPNSAPVGPAYLDKFLAGFEAPADEGETVIRP
ncbi:ATP-binding protein [Arthrobacter sp. UYCu712]|uniref:AAA family ATPase n=1 Tax=Arthrobacter sp. UYCu712 TaxID=3156340 RepID=UPI003397E9E2